jgi:hypothetical protein
MGQLSKRTKTEQFCWHDFEAERDISCAEEEIEFAKEPSDHEWIEIKKKKMFDKAVKKKIIEKARMEWCIKGRKVKEPDEENRTINSIPIQEANVNGSHYVESEAEICSIMSISIQRKEFDEIMNFKLQGKVDRFDEEESLLKIRLMRALYLGDDLNDIKRMKRLNRTHFKAMKS